MFFLFQVIASRRCGAHGVIGHMVPNYKIVMLHMVPNYKIAMLHMGANKLWNDTPSQVLSHYQFLVQQIRRANPTCYMVISGLLPRGQDMFPGKMKSIDFLSLVNRKAAYINTRLVQHRSICLQSELCWTPVFCYWRKAAASPAEQRRASSDQGWCYHGGP